MSYKQYPVEIQRYIDLQAEKAETTTKAECNVCHKLSPILWSGACMECFADWVVLPPWKQKGRTGTEVPFGSPLPGFNLFGGWIWRIPDTTPYEVAYSLLHRKKFPFPVPQNWVLIDVQLGTFSKAKQLERFLPRTPGTYAMACVQKDRIVDYGVQRVDHFATKEPEAIVGRSKQEEALARLEHYTVIQRHDDGDLTVMSQGVRYVVTTDGRVFRELESEARVAPPLRTGAATPVAPSLAAALESMGYRKREIGAMVEAARLTPGMSLEDKVRAVLKAWGAKGV